MAVGAVGQRIVPPSLSKVSHRPAESLPKLIQTSNLGEAQLLITRFIEKYKLAPLFHFAKPEALEHVLEKGLTQNREGMKGIHADSWIKDVRQGKVFSYLDLRQPLGAALSLPGTRGLLWGAHELYIAFVDPKDRSVLVTTIDYHARANADKERRIYASSPEYRTAYLRYKMEINMRQNLPGYFEKGGSGILGAHLDAMAVSGLSRFEDLEPIAAPTLAAAYPYLLTDSHISAWQPLPRGAGFGDDEECLANPEVLIPPQAIRSVIYFGDLRGTERAWYDAMPNFLRSARDAKVV